MRNSGLPSLALLGGFRLTGRAEQEIAISSKKNRALLAIVALSPSSSTTRDRLIGLLWSDRGTEQARGSLRQALVSLRRDLGALEPCPFIAQDDQVKFDRNLIEIDVLNFRDSAQAGDVELASSLFQGPLLEGLTLADEAFEDWLRQEREAVAAMATSALDALAGRQTGEARIGTAKRLVALDPLREASHRALMTAYAAAGETALALRQFENCRTILKRELGVSPARETEEFYKAILGGKIASTSTAPLTAFMPATALANGAETATLENKQPFDSIAGQGEKRSSGFTAYDLLIRGRANASQGSIEGFRAARSCFEQAIRIDPGLAAGYAWLAGIAWASWRAGWSGDSSLQEARVFARQALELDGSDSHALCENAQALLYSRDFEQAQLGLDKAHSLHAKDPDIAMLFAFYWLYWGDAEQALAWANKAAEFDPAGQYGFIKGMSFHMAGKWKEAVAALSSVRAEIPEVKAWLAASLAMGGDIQAARSAVTEYHRLSAITGSSAKNIAFLLSRHPFRQQKDADRLAVALSSAGLA